MATQFQEVFGDMLIAAPLDKYQQTLPSPEALKRKILLKHKKLPDGADEIATDVSKFQDFDIANSVKNGLLYVKDNEYFEWKPHFFVLTETKMFYSESCEGQEQGNEEDDDEDSRSSSFMRPKAKATPKRSPRNPQPNNSPASGASGGSNTQTPNNKSRAARSPSNGLTA